jgi:hypothetical protein
MIGERGPGKNYRSRTPFFTDLATKTGDFGLAGIVLSCSAEELIV